MSTGHHNSFRLPLRNSGVQSKGEKSGDWPSEDGLQRSRLLKSVGDAISSFSLKTTLSFRFDCSIRLYCGLRKPYFDFLLLLPTIKTLIQDIYIADSIIIIFSIRFFQFYHSKNMNKKLKFGHNMHNRNIIGKHI